MKKFIIFLMLFLSACSPQSNVKLIEQKQLADIYQMNSSALSDVVNDLSQTESIERIRFRDNVIETLPEGKIIDESLIKKLKALNVTLIDIGWSEDGVLNSVDFVYSLDGSVLSGEIRGLLYSRQAIHESLFEDLDTFRKDLISSGSQRSAIGYKFLQPNWYAYYQIDF